jgi:hypothetical protein
MRVMCRHLDLMIGIYGEEAGCRKFRKVAAWYAKRFGPAIEFRRRAATFRTSAEFQAVLAAYQTWRAQFCDKQGELLPKYRPPQLVASFMRADSDQTPDTIPVPRGPVEVW